MNPLVPVESAYAEISRAILQEAFEKSLEVNAALPSVRELAKQYGVSKKTIELAFKELIKDDFCYSVHGKGMFLKSLPEEMGRACLTYGIILGYQKVQEETLPFYRNLYYGAEDKITKQNDNIVCLHGWAKKSFFRKKQELAQFGSILHGIVGIGLFDEKDCLLLRDFGVPVVITDLDTVSLGIDCVVFDNKFIMEKLMDSVLSVNPNSVYYLDIFRKTEYDPAVDERRKVFIKKYSLYTGSKSHQNNLTISTLDQHKSELSPLVKSIRNLEVRTTLVCSCDFTATTACKALDSVGLKAGEDFDLAYNGSRFPRKELSGIKSTIGVLDEHLLGGMAIEMLAERIKKGSGRAKIEKLTGEVISWSPLKND